MTRKRDRSQPINWAAPEDVRTGTATPKPEDGERNKASDYPLALQRAAILIQRLERERNALRAALEEIEQLADPHEVIDVAVAAAIARAALEAKP